MDIQPLQQPEQPAAPEHRIRTMLIRGAIGVAGLVGISIGSHAASANIYSETPPAATADAAPNLTSDIDLDPAAAVVRVTSRIGNSAVASNSMNAEPQIDEAKPLIASPVRPIPSRGAVTANPAKLIPEAARVPVQPSPEAPPQTGILSPNFNFVVPAAVEHTAEVSTAYSGQQDCTANVIYINGVAAGASIANHCDIGSGPDVMQRFTDTDGQIYVMPRRTDVSIGDSVANLTQVGNTTKFIVPSAANTANGMGDDQALLVFGNFAPQDVLAQQKTLELTPEQARALKPGTPAMVYGYPAVPPGSGEIVERVPMKGVILGSETHAFINGQQLPVVWMAIKKDPITERICSEGASGAAGYVWSDENGVTTEKQIGQLSMFDDFNPALGGQTREQWQTYFRSKGILVDLSEADGLCSFTIPRVDEVSNATVLNVVQNKYQIPGIRAQRIAQAQADAMDPNYQRIIMKNAVVLNRYTDGTSDIVNGAVLEFVDNNTSIAAMVTWVGADGKLNTKFYEDYDDITYADGGNYASEPRIYEAGSVDKVVDPVTGKMSFRDVNGMYYGELTRIATPNIQARSPNIASATPKVIPPTSAVAILPRAQLPASGSATS